MSVVWSGCRFDFAMWWQRVFSSEALGLALPSPDPCWDHLVTVFKVLWSHSAGVSVASCSSVFAMSDGVHAWWGAMCLWRAPLPVWWDAVFYWARRGFCCDVAVRIFIQLQSSKFSDRCAHRLACCRAMRGRHCVLCVGADREWWNAVFPDLRSSLLGRSLKIHTQLQSSKFSDPFRFPSVCLYVCALHPRGAAGSVGYRLISCPRSTFPPVCSGWISRRWGGRRADEAGDASRAHAEFIRESSPCPRTAIRLRPWSLAWYPLELPAARKCSCQLLVCCVKALWGLGWGGSPLPLAVSSESCCMWCNSCNSRIAFVWWARASGICRVVLNWRFWESPGFSHTFRHLVQTRIPIVVDVVWSSFRTPWIEIDRRIRRTAFPAYASRYIGISSIVQLTIEGAKNMHMRASRP